MKKSYETDRLLLKTLTASNASDVFYFYKENEAFLRPWEPLKPNYFFTQTHQAQILHQEEKEQNAYRGLRLWIYKKTLPNKTIGTLCFSNIIRGCFQSCFLGYKLAYEEQGQGYMTEALEKGIEIMFNDYQLHRIEANIMPKNVRSLNLVRKLGFVEEGLAKRYIKINGRWEDHLHMVLLNESIE